MGPIQARTCRKALTPSKVCGVSGADDAQVAGLCHPRRLVVAVVPEKRLRKASSAVWLPAVLLVWGAHPAVLPGCCVLHPGPSARSPAPCGPEFSTRKGRCPGLFLVFPLLVLFLEFHTRARQACFPSFDLLHSEPRLLGPLTLPQTAGSPLSDGQCSRVNTRHLLSVHPSVHRSPSCFSTSWSLRVVPQTLGRMCPFQ